MQHGQTLFILLTLIRSAAAQNWMDFTPASGPQPTARRIAGAIYDPVDHRMIMFGGRSAGGNQNDVWAFDLDSKSWADLTPTEGDAPNARLTPNCVYDPHNHTLLMWSGQGSGLFNDIWQFDLQNAKWIRLTPPDPKPNIRYGAGSIFDPIAMDLVTFAGFTDNGRFSDTWRYQTAEQSWTNVSPDDGSPMKRCLHSASYDAMDRRMIIYGGQSSGVLDDIWAFDLGAQTWSNLTPPSRPPGRYFTAHVYDQSSHRVLIFGGNLGSAKTNEVWTFDLTTNAWQRLEISGDLPSAREGSTGILLPTQAAMVIFGGRDTQGGLLSDVWALENSTQPVHVELFSFSATVTRSTVTLKWITVSETNNHGFEIERRAPGDEFEEVGFVTCNGTTSLVREYEWSDKITKPGSYAYRLKQIDSDGSFDYSATVIAEVMPPERFDLLDNYPNPFNPNTVIVYVVPAASLISLEIYNMRGQKVRTLVQEAVHAGSHEVAWDGRNDRGQPVPSALYFYQLRAAAFQASKKMLLIR